MELTWIEIVNNIFKAHRDKDLVAEHYWMGILDEVEPTYADMLDLVGYSG